MNPRPNRDLALVNTAGFLRSLGVGLFGVVLGIYLFRLGLSSFAIGLVIAAGLAGSASATVVVSFAADRLGRRHSLVFLSLLNAVGGVALAISPSFPVLLIMAFIGMVNGTGTDRSASFALDQAVIPGLVPDVKRTLKLAWYNVLLDGGGSLGALGAGLPIFLQHRLAIPVYSAYRVLFFGFSGLCMIVAGLYSLLSPAVEIADASLSGRMSPRISADNKRVLAKITALFSLDAFGGGFLTDALVAYWFFRRFGVAEHDLGLVFFAVHILNAGSHLGAAWLARRIGLVNTMVFTHLPSSLFLMAVPFAPSLKCSFSAPLLVGGGAKVAYDLLPYKSFRGLKPPEEAVAPSTMTNVAP